MSKIWTPDLTPKGWDPDEWVEANEWNQDKEEKVVVRARIVKAKYHSSQEKISLLVRTQDGVSKVVPISKSSFTFRGKSHKEIPKKETDKEMEKTALLLNRRKGSWIRLELFKSQK